MDDTVREDMGYRKPDEQCPKNTPAKIYQFQTSRRERITSSVRDSLPDHLLRITFLRGILKGNTYVYNRDLAQQLIREGKAEANENQMEM